MTLAQSTRRLFAWLAAVVVTVALVAASPASAQDASDGCYPIPADGCVDDGEADDDGAGDDDDGAADDGEVGADDGGAADGAADDGEVGSGGSDRDTGTISVDQDPDGVAVLGQVLARTGVETGTLVGAGLLSVVVGALLLGTRRRRPATD